MTSSAEWLGAIGRWLAFSATLFLIGACAFRFGVLRAYTRRHGDPFPLAQSAAAGVGFLAALTLALAALIRLYAQAQSFADPGTTAGADVYSLILRETSWGKGWLVQLVGAGLAASGFLAARAQGGLTWGLAAVGASAVALAAPLTGHATASERAGAWGYPLDALHLLGAGTWLGTLAVLLLAGFWAAGRTEEHRDHRVAGLVEAFSPLALTGAGVAILAGVSLAFRYLEGSLSALWLSPYGRWLSIKLIVLASVMALGAWNWRVVRPALGGAHGTARIRRSATVELALGTLVLAATAVLVSLPMPGEE